MLIALLVVLGVDLVVVLALALLLVGHNRWLKKQPGAFAGAIRVSSGRVDGLRSTWTRGSGRWMRDVLVWNGAPLKLRSHVIGIDEIDRTRDAEDGELTRLGKRPVVAQLVADNAVIVLAAGGEDRDRLIGQSDV